jgi:hypothetical protein
VCGVVEATYFYLKNFFDTKVAGSTLPGRESPPHSGT